jgi:PAS domain S-box-containing protein
MAKQVDESLRRGEVARQIVKGASELNLITYDYLLYPGERPLKQWQLKHSSLSKLISYGEFGGDKEKVLIEKRISQNHEAIKALFNQIVTDYEKRGIPRRSKTQSVLYHEVSEKSASQLIGKTQMILNDASLLRNKSDGEIALTKRRASIYVIVSVVLMIIIVALTSIHLSTNIGRSLSKLEEGIQVIAGGDLDHKVDIKIKDETGKLAKAFNEMASRLKTSYASIHDLSQIEEELRKSRDELERRVLERTSELAKANEELQGEIDKCTYAEKALREQSKILEGFFTSTITPLVFLDRNFNFIRVNEAYAKACQRDVSEFPGHNHFEFYPSDAKAIFEQVVETRKPYQAIARPFTFPDHPEWGTTYWDWTLTPILDDEGEVEHLVFSLEDVTRHKRDDLALRNASVYTRGLIEASLDPLVTISRDGKVMDVNKATELVTGKSREEIIGNDFSEYFTDPEKARKGYEEVFQKGFIRDYPLAIYHTSGRVTEVLYNATVYKNEAEEVQGVFAAARDITERKEAENRMRATNALLNLFAQKKSRKEYLDAVVELIRNWSKCRCAGIRVIDEQGYVPYESYLGFCKEFWESENGLWIKQDQCVCIRVIKGERDPQDVPMMTPGGSFYCNNTIKFVGGLSDEERARYRGVCVKNGFLSVAVIPIRHHGEALGAVHLADENEGMMPPKVLEFIESMGALIGEAINRFNLEEELLGSENRLRLLSSQLLVAQEKERKRVAAELHDSIVASLSAIKFQIENIANQMKQGTAKPESLEPLTERIQQSVVETRRIMADLRPSLLDDLGIAPAISWFCRQFQETYPNINIQNKIAIEEKDVPESLKTVIFRISQEALNNIAKHSNANTVNLSLAKSDTEIELTIRDNGQGFDLSTVRPDSPGKGLGLVGMRERAELSSGAFNIESIVGEGTTIRVSWAT